MTDRIPDDELRTDLRRVADELNHPPTTSEYKDHGEYSLTTVWRRVEGSWDEILADAGLEPSSSVQREFSVVCPNCGQAQRYTGDRDRYQCKNCTTTVPLWRGQVEGRTDNDLFRILAKGPKTGDALPRYPNPDEQLFINQIRAPSRFSEEKSRGRPKRVYYLYGDERAAIRQFIDHNYEYVASCLADQSNPLQRNWDETLYQMLVEQWQWTRQDQGNDASDR